MLSTRVIPLSRVWAQERIQGAIRTDVGVGRDCKEFGPVPVRLPTGYIERRLVSPDGKRYEDIWVTATRADAENEFIGKGDADTDKDGYFKISVPLVNTS